MQNHFTICPLHPDLPPSFLLGWLGGGGALPKFNRLYLVSKVICTSFEFGWTLPLIYVQLFTLKPYSLLWKHCMCFRTLCCQCQWSTAQRKRTYTFDWPEQGWRASAILFSFALTRSTYFRVVVILYWGFLRAVRSVLRLRLTIA